MTPLYTDSPGVFDFESLRRQHWVLALLNLMLIGSLLLIHTTLTGYVGLPSPLSIALLVGGFLLQIAELLWLGTTREVTSGLADLILTWWPIALNAVLATALSIIEAGDDHQYFILMVVPVIQAAFRFNFLTMAAIIGLADFLNFFSAYWLQSLNEYVEAGATSLIYTMAGVLVWLLVNNLRQREELLKCNLEELNRARERLTAEEKLAAVGRLSSAIAHEIRNPVAMISSSLATAARPGQEEAERRKMFEIATAEASRLERLTSDFLAYARPRPARIARANVADTLSYVAVLANAHAANHGVAVALDADPGLEGDFDSTLVQQALLNLVLNAIDACPGGGTVTLRARADGAMRLEVSDSAGPIPAEVTAHLFEPFFTTKPGGTGLGLAIARNVARAHGGDLQLSINQPGRVCFSMEIPVHKALSGARTAAR